MKKSVFLIGFWTFINTLLLSSIILTANNPSVVSITDELTLQLQVVQGFSGTQSAILKVRKMGGLSYQSLEMERGNESEAVYKYTFHDLTTYGRGFDYYFEVIALDGTKFTLPEYLPSVNPYHIDLEDKLDYIPEIIKLSPDSKYVPKSDFVIAISYYAIKDKIEKNSITLILDGENITKQAKISSDMIVAKIKNPNKGIHRFYLKAKYKNGKEIKSKIWETAVETKQFTLPFELDSYLSISHSGYINNKENDYENKSQTNMRLRTTMEKEWFGMKSNIAISSYQRENRQYINRFMFDFYVPSLDVILGDNSPNMGTFVMNSKNIRGITADFHFKNFMLKVSSGTLTRKVNGEEKTDLNGNTYYTSGTFKMKNLAGMMRLGSENGFSWGISFAKNKDDISSLDKKYYAVLDTVIVDSMGVADTLYNYMTTPKDNFVVGSNVRLTLLQRRIDMGADFAMSVYNPNIIGGALSKEEITSQYANVNLPIDPKDFESIYIYNLNSQPLKPGKSNIAYRFYLTSLFFRNYLNVYYSSVGEVYKSLSTASQKADNQTIGISNSFNSIKFFHLNFSFIMSHNNIDKSKDITDYKTAYRISASYNSPDYPELFVSLGNTISEDKNNYKMGTGSFKMSTGYQFGNIPKFPTKIKFTFSNFDNSDKKFDNFSYNRKMLGINTETFFENLPLVTSLYFNYGFDRSKTKIMKDEINDEKKSYTTFGIQNKLNLLQERLKPYFKFSIKNYSNADNAQNLMYFNLGTSYNFYENTNLFTDVGFITYKDKNNENNNSNSFNWRLTISYKF